MEKFQTSFYTEVDVRSDVVVCTEEEVTTEDEARSILRDGSCCAVNALRRARSRTEEELSTDIGREAIRATEVVFETKTEGEDVALVVASVTGSVVFCVLELLFRPRERRRAMLSWRK